MYLKSLKICNFRKFRTSDNVVEFADAESYDKRKNDKTSDVNVASTVTLIVGKNNAGKTTIIEALKKLINENVKFGIKDFNIEYLSELADRYSNGDYKELPTLEFEVVIGLDKGIDDYVTNIVPFLTIGGVEDTQVSIIIKFEIIEEAGFITKLKKVFEKKEENVNALYELCKLMEDNINSFDANYYNSKQKRIEKFKLKDLIDFVPILVRDVESGTALSNAFNRIVKYRYEKTFSADKEVVEKEIDNLNKTLTGNIEAKHTDAINKTLSEIVAKKAVQVKLSADISFEKLMYNLIKYEYVEGTRVVPENQFGLGYSNLMMIIAKLIDYIEKYPDEAFNSKINLISIEEPETHMHPQMQEQFIQYINVAINTLLGEKDKHVNSQLILTTHSSHIVNSKIQSGGTFNNINYITEKDGKSVAILLNDEAIIPTEEKGNEEYFKFIKKHIKFGVSNALFSDAVIFVEGITEEAILPYYLNEDEELKHRYITVVRIDGAHAFVYKNLLAKLQIPAVIITDLDIKRTEDEKDRHSKIDSLVGKTTTNKTIENFIGKKDIENIKCPIEFENIRVFFQGKYDSLYRTSFEEAFISENKDNPIVNSVLKEIRPGKYTQIVGNPVDYNKNSSEAYEWQRSLSSLKSEFASSVLYKMLVEENDIPVLPAYIQNALDYIKQSI